MLYAKVTMTGLGDGHDSANCMALVNPTTLALLHMRTARVSNEMSR